MSQRSSEESSKNQPLIQVLSRLFSAMKAMGITLTQLASKLSRSMKKGTAIAALVMAGILAGHSVSAQVTPPSPPPPLSQVSVPEPDNIKDFIKNKVSAIALGKSLFWDMQLGSDATTNQAPTSIYWYSKRAH